MNETGRVYQAIRAGVPRLMEKKMATRFTIGKTMNKDHRSKGVSPDSAASSRITRITLLLLLCLALLPIAAQAGLVYGRVYLDRSRMLPAGEHVTIVINGIQNRIRLDHGGRYRLVVAPGTYAVYYCDSHRQKWSGVIRSLHGPAPQNIRLDNRHEPCQP